MAEIGLAASIIAVIQISRTVIARAYKYGQSVKNAKNDIERIVSELKDVESRLARLQDLADRAQKSGRPLDCWPALVSMNQEDGPLFKCKLALNCLLAELTPVDSRLANMKERALWPNKVTKVEKALEAVVQQKNSFIEILNMEQVGQIQEIRYILTDISKSQSDEDRNKILQWLSHTDPTTNHITACTKHEPQTGDWFIQGKEYSWWKTMPSSFLWLHGIPGCGKTILCSTIIENTKNHCAAEPACSVAYFYFSFNDTEKQNTRNFLRSVFAQLANQKQRIPGSLQSLYNGYQHGQPPTADLKRALQSLLEVSGQTFIIADALDECPGSGAERMELCALLTEFSGWALPNLHILVTSRKEPDINEALSSLVTNPPICIQSKQVDADIRLHVRTELANDPKLKKWSPQIKKEIEDTLVERADGMFRWVFCQLESLRKCLKPNAVRKVLKSLPKTLDDTYARILLSIDDEYRREAIAAIKWLAFSDQPLCVEELAEAAIINPQADLPCDPEERLADPHDILQILSSLVVTSTREGRSIFSGWLEPRDVEEIKLAHFSVKEYLISDRIKPLPVMAFCTTDVIAHRAITESCLLYILNYDHVEDKSLSIEDLEKFPLLQYACRYWPAHAKANMENSLSDLIFKLFISDSGLSSWLRVYRPDAPWEGPFKMQYPNLGSPIYYASYLGLCCVVDMLIDSKADVNAQGGEHGSALQAASIRGHGQIVQQLLEKGADVNAQGGRYGSALQEASAEGQDQIVQQLLEKGADINAQGGMYGSALQAASVRGHGQIFQQLLEKGADVNAQGGMYGSALQAASIRGHGQIVQQLLEKGAVRCQ